MPKRIGLLLNEWPSADRAAWERANASVDVFDSTAVAAGWRKKTRDQARYAYARWLTYLRQHDPSMLDTPLALRVTKNGIQAYVSRLEKRLAVMSIAAELQHLALALGAMAPTSDWAWLRQRQYAYQKSSQPREKRHRIVDPRRLIQLGLKLMDRAKGETRPGEKACCYRDGLLIALLTLLPMRRRSLAALTIGRHLQRVGGHYVIELEAEDTKSGHPVAFDVPAILTDRIHAYLEQYRPLFPLAADELALWLSSKGGPLGGEAIHTLVCRRTMDAFGMAIYPHLFRDIAVTAIARHAPGALDVARDLMTHAKRDTTQKYYSRAQTADAARIHAAEIARLRSAI